MLEISPPPCQSFKFPFPNNNKVIPVDTKLHRRMAQKGESEQPPNVIPDMHPNFKTFSRGACPHNLLSGWPLNGQLDVFHILSTHKTNSPTNNFSRKGPVYVPHNLTISRLRCTFSESRDCTIHLHFVRPDNGLEIRCIPCGYMMAHMCTTELHLFSKQEM